MSLVLIRTFLSIVETGSLVNASRSLNITQSTVTSRLKSLEEEIGQTLVHRQKSGIVLTSAGMKFHRYALAMSNMWNQALLETSLPSGMEAVCNLGCEPDLWPQIGRPLAARIREDYPSTALTIYPAGLSQLDDWLGIGVIDAVLTYRPTNHAGTSSIELENESLKLYSTRPDGPVRGDPDYVYFDAGPEFGKQHATTYADAGVANHTFGSAVWLINYLMDCGGSAYLPSLLAAPLVDEKRLFLLKDAPEFSRQVYLIANDKSLNDWSWLPSLASSI